MNGNELKHNCGSMWLLVLLSFYTLDERGEKFVRDEILRCYWVRVVGSNGDQRFWNNVKIDQVEKPHSGTKYGFHENEAIGTLCSISFDR